MVESVKDSKNKIITLGCVRICTNLQYFSPKSGDILNFSTDPLRFYQVGWRHFQGCVDWGQGSGSGPCYTYMLEFGLYKL